MARGARWWRVGAVAAALAVVAGCSSSSLDAGTVGHEVARHANPAGELLTGADLPNGWTVDTSRNNATNTTCTNVDQFLIRGQPAHVSRQFKRGLNEGLVELILVYGSSGAANGVATSVEGKLAGCKQFNVTSDGFRLTFHGGRFSLPAESAQSVSSWQYTTSAQGRTQTVYLAFVQLDDEVVLLTYTGPGKPAESFREAVGIALQKAR